MGGEDVILMPSPYARLFYDGLGYMVALTGTFILPFTRFNSIPDKYLGLSAINICNLILFLNSVGKGTQVNATALHPFL